MSRWMEDSAMACSTACAGTDQQGEGMGCQHAALCCVYTSVGADCACEGYKGWTRALHCAGRGCQCRRASPPPPTQQTSIAPPPHHHPYARKHTPNQRPESQQQPARHPPVSALHLHHTCPRHPQRHTHTRAAHQHHPPCITHQHHPPALHFRATHKHHPPAPPSQQHTNPRRPPAPPT